MFVIQRNGHYVVPQIKSLSNLVKNRHRFCGRRYLEVQAAGVKLRASVDSKVPPHEEKENKLVSQGDRRLETDNLKQGKRLELRSWTGLTQSG